MRKLTLTLFLIIITITVSIITVSGYDAVNFAMPQQRFISYNPTGTYICSMDGKKLSCTSLSKPERCISYNSEANIKAVSQYKSDTYALYTTVDLTEKYHIIKMDMNGAVSKYNISQSLVISAGSFAVSDNTFYFLESSGKYSEAIATDLNSNVKLRYYVGKSANKIFSNGSNVYILTYDLEVYRLENSKAVYCCTVTDRNIYNAGDGYIADVNGYAFSLKDGSRYKTSATDYYSITVCNGKTAYLDNDKIKILQSGYVSADTYNSILTSYNGQLCLVYSDGRTKFYREQDIKKEVFSPNISQNNNTSQNDNAESELVFSDGYIVCSKPMSITDFKGYAGKTAKLYDNNSYVTSGKIKTGMIAEINGNSYKLILLGDISGEGNINSSDIRKLFSDKLGKSELSDAYEKAADINTDGVVDNIDLVMLSRLKD